MTFVKGISGNPSGHPKDEVSLTAQVKLLLRQNPERARKIADKLIKIAENGYLPAIELVWNRVDGKLVETRRVEGELPIRLLFVPAQATIDAPVCAPEPILLPAPKKEVGLGARS